MANPRNCKWWRGIGEGLMLCTSPRMAGAVAERTPYSEDACLTCGLVNVDSPLGEVVERPQKPRLSFGDLAAKRSRCQELKAAGQECHEFDAPATPAPSVSAESLTPRHLLYHVMPQKGNGVWQMNVERLRARLSLFTGRRVVAVVTGGHCDPPEAVQEAFGGDRIDEWIIRPNDARLREVTTWAPLWEQVAGLPGCTFYAHAKGVTRPVNRGVTIHRWTAMMYAANLDYWPVVEDLLRRHPVAGALKKIGAGFQGSRSSWHYSGSFFWVRNAALADRWRSIDQMWWGNEAWPGCHFRPEDAGCIFHEGAVPTLDMYAMPYLERVEAEFEAWKSLNQKSRSATG